MAPLLLLLGELVLAGPEPSALPTPHLQGAAPLSAPAFDPTRSLAPLVKAVGAAVVTIDVASPSPVFQHLGLPDGGFPRMGQGSGFFISPDGLCLTNHHVVSSASKITLVLADGRRLDAKVVNSDAGLDVALLKAEGTDFPYVALGDSDGLEVGDWVVVMGNTLGLGTTVTIGIVSGKEREVGPNPLGFQTFVQTDAAINEGNSGGPLFDLHGKVVGMAVAIMPRANKVGFAIPSKAISAVLGKLQTGNRVSRGFLGVQPQTLSEELRKSLGVKAARGALVTSVFDDTPAQTAGVKIGDVVVEVDGKAVHTDAELIATISTRNAGDKVVLTVERGAKNQQITVTLTERPTEGATPPPPLASPLGLELAAMSAEILTERGLAGGVLIERVEPHSPARGRLKTGDVIVEVNRHKVADPADVERMIAKHAGTTAFFLVLRGEEQQFVALTLP